MPALHAVHEPEPVPELEPVPERMLEAVRSMLPAPAPLPRPVAFEFAALVVAAAAAECVDENDVCPLMCKAESEDTVLKAVVVVVAVAAAVVVAVVSVEATSDVHGTAILVVDLVRCFHH